MDRGILTVSSIIEKKEILLELKHCVEEESKRVRSYATLTVTVTYIVIRP